MSSRGSSSPFAAPGSVPRVVVEALMHRGELASIELEEAKIHSARTGIAIALCGILLLLGGFTATFAVAAAVWHRDDRGLILGVLTLAYFLGAGALAFVASRRIRDWQPFSETCRQFHEDCACIQKSITSGTR
jgi:uncharacterized membrane protein YqjE